jgi:[ribosomal protein S18]-alanine N-acetyltransferase
MIQPPTPYILRPLTAADLPDVLAIDRQSFPTAKKEAVYRYELLQNQLAHYQALTRKEADDQETLLGFAGYWILGDEIHISFIAVDPSARGAGYGELLLLNMLYLALDHEASLVTLEVRRSNNTAQKLYQKYRFAEVGVRRRYYRDTGEDAILMTVELAMAADYELFLEQRKQALFRRPAFAP